MKKSLAKALLKKCDEVSSVLKSVSHPVRLKVLCQMIDQERSVGELTDFCEISQSGMSQLLARMKSEGVIDYRRDGTKIYYRISEPRLLRLLRAIKEIYC